MKIGIIGGTGVYQLGDSAVAPVRVETPYGAALLARVSLGDRELLFVPRHGSHHQIPPHRVNYRAKIAALKQEGCRCVLATNAVGSIRRDLPPGHLVLADQFLDFTRARPLTFYDGEDSGVRHVDVTEPYCPVLRDKIVQVVTGRGEPIENGAVYVCTEGPRFETPAEIRMFKQLGGDLVGMTGVPEVVLAREAGLCYATICVVTNYAAGIADQPLTGGEVGELMSGRLPFLREILVEVAQSLDEDWECSCP